MPVGCGRRGAVEGLEVTPLDTAGLRVASTVVTAELVLARRAGQFGQRKLDRRDVAQIPDDVTFKTKGEIALELIDQALAWKIPAGVVAADAGYGNRAAFRLALTERGLVYAVGIDGSTSVWSTTVWPEAADPSAPDAAREVARAVRRKRCRRRWAPTSLPRRCQKRTGAR